jgi:prepilin-type processing-associated H-X9-DG protein
MYANENDGKLPLNRSGWWLWDIAYSTSDFVIASGGTRDTFYCPSDLSKNGDMSIVWQFGQDPTYGTPVEQVQEPETGRDGVYRVTSYFWLMDTQAGRGDPPIYEPGTPRKRWAKNLNDKGAGEVELVLDATLSTENNRNGNFVEVAGGLYSRHQLYDRTNHLRKGSNPEGSNILFLDGHQQWRNFTEMEYRYSPGGGSGPPFHWW